MLKILSLAARNLRRYVRRTVLTTLLITLSVIAVLLFMAVSGSFRNMMVAQITDSMLGNLQIHRRGYVASIDNLPLNLNMTPNMVKKAEQALDTTAGIAAYSPRVKFGAMFSNFTETTSIRVNGVDPAMEAHTSPLLAGRLLAGSVKDTLVAPGKILIPELLAKGMKVKVGDTVVLVATNKDGSVNGMPFVVQGVLEGVSGPGGRDGYVNIADARKLLRMDKPEVSEIAVRLSDPRTLPRALAHLREALGSLRNQQGKPVFEVHSWEKLSPFSNIAKMIELLDIFIKVMLIAVVLISIMNVMIMAVYERIREIGTIMAIGTQPGRILGLFVSEGFLLGLLGTVLGTAVSLAAIYALNVHTISFSFGRQEHLMLQPSVALTDILTVGAMVLVIAVLASLQPAWKASRMDPITALRHL
ncbi:MAG: ABC transporter permease [Gammaproteobacteria bacterium]